MSRGSSSWCAHISDPPLLAGCPACGEALPAYARFCAACGTPQPNPAPRAPLAQPRSGPPGWVLAMFWAGTALALIGAVIYSVLAAAPIATGPNAGQLRATSLVFAVAAAILFGLQLVAAIGLGRGRAWALTPATLACIVWALTCIGLPVAVLVLAGLWRAEGPTNRLSRP